MTDTVNENTRKEIKSFVDRIERLDGEKKAISDDIKDIYAEARGRGYDVKALRALIAERKKDPNERTELEALLDLYRDAVQGSLDV